jgi:hypothetical protein
MVAVATVSVEQYRTASHDTVIKQPTDMTVKFSSLKAPSLHLPGGTKEYHDKPLSE